MQRINYARVINLCVQRVHSVKRNIEFLSITSLFAVERERICLFGFRESRIYFAAVAVVLLFIAITVLSYMRESVSLGALTHIATKAIYERSHNAGAK